MCYYFFLFKKEDISMDKPEYETQITELQHRISYLEHQLELKDQEIQRLKNRGAGRTPKFSDREKDKIVADRKSGKSIREVATMNHCSIGYVHKIISEQNMT